jgi:hypothetical protein
MSLKKSKSQICFQQGDLNGYLIENRFRNNKSNGEEQIKQWIIDLLDAIQFLNDHSLIHKRLNT